LGVITPTAPCTLLVRSGQGSRERFGLLLLILVTSYLISAFTTGALVAVVQIVLFVGVALLALRSEGFPRRTAQGAIGSSKTFQYFSFTTLTTLGYGDFTAAASGNYWPADRRPGPGHCRRGELPLPLVTGQNVDDHDA